MAGSVALNQALICRSLIESIGSLTLLEQGSSEALDNTHSAVIVY